MMSLHSMFCKIDTNSNKLFVLLEPHSSFRFQYRLLTMTTFFEIAVYRSMRCAQIAFYQTLSEVSEININTAQNMCGCQYGI